MSPQGSTTASVGTHTSTGASESSLTRPWYTANTGPEMPAPTAFRWEKSLSDASAR